MIFGKKTLRLNLPVDTLYYLEGADQEVNRFVRTHTAEIERAMGDGLFPYTLLYLPNSNPKARARISCRLLPADNSSLGRIVSAELNSTDSLMTDIQEFARRVLADNTELLEGGGRRPHPACRISEKKFSPSAARPSMMGSFPKREILSMEEQSEDMCAEEVSPCIEEPVTLSFSIGEGQGEVSYLQELAQRIRDEIAELQRQNGINILINELGEDFFESLKKVTAQPPYSLTIDDHFRILIKESGKEVPMPTLSRVVYFLFLKHPEGIRLKEITDYREELLNIYLTVSPRGDVEQMRRSIDDLVDPESGSLNQKISRITAAFRSLMPTDWAQHYIITGPRGENRRIQLDRSLVSLPAELL